MLNETTQDATSLALSIDPRAEKYPAIDPYCAMGDNPIVCVDPDGREIIVQNVPEQNGWDYFTGQIFEITGIEIGIDENNKLIVEGGQAGVGSRTARNKLLSAMNSSQKITLNLIDGANNKHELGYSNLDLKTGNGKIVISWPIYYYREELSETECTNFVDNTTKGKYWWQEERSGMIASAGLSPLVFGIGMTFFHELSHVVDRTTDPSEWTLGIVKGPTVEFENKIYRELNLPIRKSYFSKMNLSEPATRTIYSPPYPHNIMDLNIHFGEWIFVDEKTKKEYSVEFYYTHLFIPKPLFLCPTIQDGCPSH